MTDIMTESMALQAQPNQHGIRNEHWHKKLHSRGTAQTLFSLISLGAGGEKDNTDH